MAIVRKVNPEWKPSENNGLQVGEQLEVTDYRRLVEEGMAELIDDNGNVLPLPGTVFVCGICYEKIDNHAGYLDHVLDAHKIAKKIDVVEPEEEELDDTYAIVGEELAKKELEESARIEQGTQPEEQVKDEEPQPELETWGQKMARLRREKKARESK